MTQKEFDTVLENHQHWLNRDCEYWAYMKAELGEADLHGLDLEGVDLRYAYMYRANLQGANLYSANLEGATLNFANLQGAYIDNANLCRVGLQYADLSKASLCGAELCGANLLCACLESTSLTAANFSQADLRCADLRCADLFRAYIVGVNLYHAKLSDAEDVPYIPMICPEEGEFIGWKKAVVDELDRYRKVIVKLKIPKDAKRSSATTRKCRCSKAKVLAIYNLDGTEAPEKFCKSDFDHSFIYEIGKTIKVEDFEEDRWKECAKGIHFFINRQEALDYY